MMSDIKILQPGQVVRFNLDGTEVIHNPPPEEVLEQPQNDTATGRGLGSNA